MDLQGDKKLCFPQSFFTFPYHSTTSSDHMLSILKFHTDNMKSRPNLSKIHYAYKYDFVIYKSGGLKDEGRVEKLMF